MGLKSLFFTSDEDDVKNEVVETKPTPTVFPTVFPPTPTPTPSTSTPTFGAMVDNQHLNKFVEVYQKCFDDANQTGYDFYEFFQAIVNSGGIDNPQMYVMAMNMGLAMDKTCNKVKLLSQADFYLDKINTLYTQSVSSGTAKRQELLAQKDSENQSLNAELTNLRAQLQAIQNQIAAKESALYAIDGKYVPLINEVEQKLQANETAKTMIVSNINKVKDGINNNIK